MSKRQPRKSLSRKTRFEVFKRDKFTCQYCGASSPQAVLVVDHIKPVSKQGNDDILNLITSCFECNAGKSDRELSDDAVVQKRKAQLDDLQERREQIEMMLEWQQGLADLGDHALDSAARLWSEIVTGFSLNESGRHELKKTIRRFGFEETLTGMRASVDSYLEYKDDVPTSESVEKAFDFIVRICAAKQRAAEKPYMQELYYTRGILRNRFNYCNQNLAMELLEDAVLSGIGTDTLRRMATRARNWSQWRDEMDILMEQRRSK